MSLESPADAPTDCTQSSCRELHLQHLVSIIRKCKHLFYLALLWADFELSWFYRILPSCKHKPYEKVEHKYLTANFSKAVRPPRKALRHLLICISQDCYTRTLSLETFSATGNRRCRLYSGISFRVARICSHAVITSRAYALWEVQEVLKLRQDLPSTFTHSTLP